MIAGLLVVLIAVALTPEQTNPAFTTAVTFVEAAGKGDDSTALAQLDATLRTTWLDHCPQGSVSACVQSYTPPEWGKLVDAAFRRPPRMVKPGTSRSCRITRRVRRRAPFASTPAVEPNGAGGWQVTRWAGFVHCSDPTARNMDTNPDTPIRAP